MPSDNHEIGHGAMPHHASLGLVGILRTALAWKRRHAEENKLYGLSDQMLKDVGVSRGEIPGLAAGRSDRS